MFFQKGNKLRCCFNPLFLTALSIWIRKFNLFTPAWLFSSYMFPKCSPNYCIATYVSKPCIFSSVKRHKTERTSRSVCGCGWQTWWVTRKRNNTLRFPLLFLLSCAQILPSNPPTPHLRLIPEMGKWDLRIISTWEIRINTGSEVQVSKLNLPLQVQCRLRCTWWSFAPGTRGGRGGTWSPSQTLSAPWKQKKKQ